MPTEIPITELSLEGVAPPAQTDSDAGGMFLAGNDGRTFLEIVSTDAAPQTVAFAIAETIDGEAAQDKTVSVPAGATRLAGPFPQELYSQADGSLTVKPSVAATLKLRAYRSLRRATIIVELEP